MRHKMKPFFSILLLLSTLIFSQENYNPDNLVSKSTISQNCFVQAVNSNYIIIKSVDNSESKIFLNTISEITIGDLGLVYSESTGYSVSLDSINAFLKKRNADYSFLINQPKLVFDEQTHYFNGDKRWTFAIHYFPSIAKQLVFAYNPHIYSNSPYLSLDRLYPTLYYELEQNLVSMESQLGFNVADNLFAILSIGYSADLYKSTSTTTNHRTWEGTISSSSYENQNSMDKFLFEIGLKRYFGNFDVGNVNPFITLSIGKQFAFADSYYKSHYSGQTNDYIYKNNENEFMEGLNSPIIISFGFGTEYAISESLSLSGFFKVKYNSASSTYKWENIYMGLVTERGDEDVENKTIRFKTGIGLNFFF